MYCSSTKVQCSWQFTTLLYTVSKKVSPLMFDNNFRKCVAILDYCNVRCCGITDELTHCLQLVQNAATRLMTSTRWCDHISPVLHQLYWLPMQQRIVLKIATLVYRSLSDGTFTTAGPQVWSSLPPNLRLCGLSYGQFRWLQKTFLFGQWGHGAVWTVFYCAE